MEGLKESQIQRQITDWLTAQGIFWVRMNSGAMQGIHKGKTRFVRFGQRGMADILVLPKVNHRVLSLMPVWIEIKTSSGRQSAEQVSFQVFVEEMGHKYLLARSVDDVAELWEASKR